MDARHAAATLIDAVLRGRRALDASLAALPAMEARDRGFAHMLAATVLRRLGTLDAILDQCLSRAPPDAVRDVIRIGAAQLLFLGTAPHAAVDSAVTQARAIGGQAFGGLTNAVLRRIARDGAALREGLDEARLDTPDWLWAAWWGAYGPATYDIALAHRMEAPLDLSLRPGAAPPPGSTLLPTGTARLPSGTRVPDLPGFAEGAFWVQDAAASLPAQLLAARPGEHVLDLCAAPGGKTAQLAATRARVTAVESDAARLPRLRENLTRLHLQVETIHADATKWRPSALVDAVLLDAPCTATGTIRRHPDVAHIKRARDVTNMVAAQDALLDAAAAMLRPGGRLVFAVCSLQPEEGFARVLAATQRLALRHDPFTPAELAMLPEALDAQGCLRTLPSMLGGQGGMDGFFAARLLRPA
jgi:16S rRNA (cytosine967-C5)-methyltransferase